MKTSPTSIRIFLLAFSLIVLSFIFYSFKTNQSFADPYVGEWSLVTDTYPLSDVAKPILSGSILQIKKYGMHYTVELDTEGKDNKYIKATIPAIYKDNMLFIYTEKGSMPAILNNDHSKLFYFAEFKKRK